MTWLRSVTPLTTLLSLSLLALGCADDGASESAGEAGTDDEVGSSDESSSGEETAEESGSSGTTTETDGSSETDSSTESETDSSTDTETDSSTDTDTETDGSSETDDSTGETGETGTEGTGTEETDTGDTGTEETDTGEPAAPWLLHVRNDINSLVKIDVATGVETTVCNFQGSVNYPSITFGISGELFGSRQGQELDLIDPCTCATQYVGNMGFTGINGITANGLEILRLYGISIASDVLLDVDTMTAMSTVVGNGLGIDIGFSGSTWSSDIVGLYAINANDDKLYQVDIVSGLASEIVDLDVNFGTVGIEWHPETGELYACTDGHLYAVDTEDGTTMEIGNMGHSCNNLAAPWTAVACIDEL